MAGKVIGCKQCYANISVPNVQFDEEELAAEIEAAAPKRKKKKRKETDKPIASDGEVDHRKQYHELPLTLFLLIGFATLLNGCSSINYLSLIHI